MNSMMKNGRSFKIAPPSFNGYKENDGKDNAWEGCEELSSVGIANVKAIAPILYWSDEVKEEEKEKLDADVDCAVADSMFDHEIVICHAKSYNHSSGCLQVELSQDSIVRLDGEQIEWRNFHTSLRGEVAISVMGDGIDTDIVMNFDSTYVNGYGSLPVQTAQSASNKGADQTKTGVSWEYKLREPIYYTAQQPGTSKPFDKKVIESMIKDIQAYEDQNFKNLWGETAGMSQTTFVNSQPLSEPVQLELPLETASLTGVEYLTTTEIPLGGFTPSAISGLNPAASYLDRPLQVAMNYGSSAVAYQGELAQTAFMNNEMPKIDWTSLGASISEKHLAQNHSLAADNGGALPGEVTYGYAGLIPGAAV